MLVIIIVVAVLIFGVYSTTAKKKKTEERFENEILVNDVILDANIGFYSKLDEIEKIRFEKEIKDFLQYVKITGVKVEVTSLDKILVASSAIIPVFAFPGSKYPNLHEVLLYSGTFNMNFQSEGNEERDILGMVGTGYMEGKMLLSKPALEEGFSNKTGKRNTAIHEFVHLIDKSDGETDGIPGLLLDKQYVIPWLALVHEEMEKIKEGESDIDAYGYTNKSEFFAVASEYFSSGLIFLKKNIRNYF